VFYGSGNATHWNCFLLHTTPYVLHSGNHSIMNQVMVDCCARLPVLDCKVQTTVCEPCLNGIFRATWLLKYTSLALRPSDAGVYTCVATNEVGSDQKDTSVSVNVAPVIGDGVGNRIPENIQPKIGEPFTLLVSWRTICFDTLRLMSYRLWSSTLR